MIFFITTVRLIIVLSLPAAGRPNGTIKKSLLFVLPIFSPCLQQAGLRDCVVRLALPVGRQGRQATASRPVANENQIFIKT